ncbi:site-specific DNA-methyltransferase [Chryseobacterium sp. G0240]|uniref:DNA-methyltransferase n=1 Tax=Chryseobacterium sp. G0240 TaxID=2487066 RepID=UPI000F44E77D|nr:site-specific DNA-methyltransferase [Chryseobacterium sp. G0240]ROI02928.1 site-specific DNA-methyltransferase [Chryseobacterium sp. G0240]
MERIKLFNEDNLELMRKLPEESIDLIYCDILYGTGRNFGEYQDLKPVRSIIEDHYVPRIKEMYRLLKPTGSIYIHCDWHINHWIRIILDELFGYERCVNEIIWCYTGPGVNNQKNYSRKHDNIYLYSKSNKYTFNTQDIKVPVSEDTLKKFETGGSGFKGKKADFSKGKLLEDWWYLAPTARFKNETGLYPTQKSIQLMERVIRASSNEGDTVADFYMGGGTTAVVCEKLNRNFIGCDINVKAIDVTKKRLVSF